MSEYEELAPEIKELIIETMKTQSPYWSLLGMELVDIKKGWAQVRLPFDKKLVHPLGIAHGGAIFSPADSAVAMALIGMVEKDETFVTIEMKINYLATFTKGEIIAEAKIIHKGRNTALGDIIVKNGNGDLVAKALATYMIVPKKGF
jgi:acyl-CoA thioesterase